MRVSTFELLFARIATLPPGPLAAVGRRVVQGYFLTITNLENRQISLSMRLTTATNPGNRVITAANTQIIGDTGTVNNIPVPFTNTTPSFPGGITVTTTPTPNPSPFLLPAAPFILAPQQTGLIAILPNFGAVLAAANLEIRGYVELFQNRLVPFQETPAARVLLTPEIRGTFLDNDYPANAPNSTNAELDFDQVVYDLPLASGQAENTLEALPLIT
jgi:hypothetical protein